MKSNLNKFVAAALMTGAAFSGSALAMSGTSTTSPANVANDLNLRIVIPSFLSFRVGTVGATIDMITFSPTAAQLGTGAPIAGAGGDAGGTGSNVSVTGNNGQVTIGTTVTGGGSGMGTGTPADGFISFAEVGTVSTSANLPAPALANGGIAPVNVVLGGGVAGAGKVTNRSAVWNFSYLNNTVPSAGTYNGTVTYTATMP